MNSFHIESNGCGVLWNETERIAKYFRLNGWNKVDSPNLADINIITCCGVTSNQEDQAIKMIELIESSIKRTASKLIVAGCLPAFASERIRSISPSSILLRYDQLYKLDMLIQAHIPFKDVYFNTNSELDPNEKAGDQDIDLNYSVFLDKTMSTKNCEEACRQNTLRHSIWQDNDVYQIKVGYGCPGNCSYCATKLAIGNFHSVSKSLVMRQYLEGLQSGFKKFVLMGDEVGSYGQDFGESIIDLLCDMHNIEQNVSISISYIHPDIFVRYYDHLRPYFASGFINFFTCAIQTASSKLLKAMNRNPNIEPFIRCMEDINKKKYLVNKHTQIIIGFPNETAEDVEETINALMRCDFDHVSFSIFSPRKGTKAYLMEDNVPQSIKERRLIMYRSMMMDHKYAKIYKSQRDTWLKYVFNKQ